MDRFLKLVGTGKAEEAKNGRKYLVASFRPVSMIGAVTVLSNQKPMSRVLWDSFTDAQGNQFPADGLFTALQNGELTAGGLVEGQIVRVNTTPYQIEGKTVTSYTTVLFSNEDLYTYVNRQLKSNLAVAVDETGAATADLEQLRKNAVVTTAE